MPAGSTYTPIATTTLGSAASSVTFSSIAGTYTDIIAILNTSITTGTADVRIQVNGDTGSNYSTTVVTGSGSTAGSFRYSNQTYGRLNYDGYADTTFGQNAIVNLMNYANSTTFKTILARGNNAANGTSAVVNLWRSTSAINSITFSASASTFVTGSRFTLYGIASA
jgi:hypothetical protein